MDELQDEKFVCVFRNGLNVQLKNPDELGQYLELFPDNDFGVAQGSSLSAFAGNVFLRDIDAQFQDVPGICLVRYIDDLALLGHSNELVQGAKSTLRKALMLKGLSLYDPAKAPDKAGEGHVRDGFEFLGCQIWFGQIEPSKRSRASILKKVDSEIRRARESIENFINDSTATRNRENTFGQCVAMVDDIVRGWANAYRFVNNRLIFLQLDRAIRAKMFEFADWTMKLAAETGSQKARFLGFFQTHDVEYKSLEELAASGLARQENKDKGSALVQGVRRLSA